MRNCNSVWRLVAVVAGFAGLAVAAVSPAMAVIVVGDGSGNTTASYPTDSPFPGTDPGWNDVGTVYNKTGVYLGNGWVLTADHVIGGSDLPSIVIFDGVSYNTVPGSTRQLYLPGNPSQPSDLALFQLNPSQPLPASPSFTISSSTPAMSSWVVGLGNGPLDRSALTYWNSSGGTLAGPVDAAYSGYTFDKINQGLRWGEGQVSGAYSGANALNDGAGITDAFYTTFVNVNSDMQSAYGDSGGGAFSYNNGKWQLSGIVIARGSNNDLPADLQDPASGGVAVFNETYSYMADLSQYSGQINQITQVAPEPSSVALLVGGGAALLAYRLLRPRRRQGPAEE
jgi:hypothetical protein